MAGVAEIDDFYTRINQARLDLHRHFRPTRTEKVLTDVAEMAARAGDDLAVDSAILELAAVARYQHHLAQARALGTEALERFTLHQNRAGVAAAHLELAKIDLAAESDPEPHLNLAERAVFDVTHEIEARIGYVRARAALRQGELSQAGRLLRRALALVENPEHCAYYRARYLAQLGLVERLRGAEIAREYLQDAKALAEKGGFLRVKAACLLDLGQIALKHRNYTLAYDQLAEAAALFVQVDDQLGAAHACSALGAVWRKTGQVDKAIEALQLGLDTFVAREHLAGEALAHRLRAQCYADLLDGQVGRGQEPSRDYAELAFEEIELAIEQFAGLKNRDGQAVALATKGRLLYQTTGAAAALGPAMAAVELLGQVRGQFCQGVERLEFCRLHGWVFGFAMLCAAENKDVTKALRVAAIVRAETLGGVARQAFATVPGVLGETLREILEHEQALRPSASDAIHLTVSVSELRKKRDRLIAALDRELVDALSPPLERSRLGPGCYRLCVHLFDDGLYVVCEGPAETTSDVQRVELSAEDRRRVGAIARVDRDAIWDARPRRWEQLGELIVPADLGRLRSELLGGEVSILEIEAARELVSFPFGALLLDGHPLDELTCVLLSPSDLPWLWRGRGQDSRPPGPPNTDAAFQEIVNAVVSDLGPAGSWNIVELMEIAAGEPSLKRLFPGDAAVAPHFSMAVERHLQNGLSLLEAVRYAKASHRRGCGAACPAAHVGGYVVAGRLADVANIQKIAVNTRAYPQPGERSRPGRADAGPVAAAHEADSMVSTRVGASILVQYIRPVDEFEATIADGAEVEIFELLDDLELIFDATEPGRLLGLVLRGARLGRPLVWLHAAATVMGPTMWATYGHVALDDTRPTLFGDREKEQDEVQCRINVPADEWIRLRRRTWLALHGSLRRGEWWDEEPPTYEHLELLTEGAGEPWVITAARPIDGRATNLYLPKPLAQDCGLDPVGYVRQTEHGFAVRFDITADPSPASFSPDERLRSLKLHLVDPSAATATAMRIGDDFVVSFEIHGQLNNRGPLVIVAEAAS
jgi:tetratricopeptide (TPR) repeat protein